LGTKGPELLSGGMRRNRHLRLGAVFSVRVYSRAEDDLQECPQALARELSGNIRQRKRGGCCGVLVACRSRREGKKRAVLRNLARGGGTTGAAAAGGSRPAHVGRRA